MNNIFQFSPKELTTDAFFAWFFIELEKNPLLHPHLPKIFAKLGLIEDQTSIIENINVDLQKSSVDLLLHFNANKESITVLFENKTHSTIHSNQLNRYRDKFPNCKKYKYMKLGFINYQETQEVKKSGYDIINAFTIHALLEPLRKIHLIIDHYCDFLNSAFIDNLKWLDNELYISSDISRISERYSQQKILSDLHKNIDGLTECLLFKAGANNNGTPWTQLDFCWHKDAYGNGIDEFVFWRIDKRGGRPYIRLNQYAEIDGNLSSCKMQNLQKLVNIASAISISLGLNSGGRSNRGLKETEIAIFFLDENPLSKIHEVLETYTRRFFVQYEDYKNQTVTH